RKSLDDAAHSIDIAVRLLERDRGREGRAYPQVSFLELGQELQTERRQRDYRKSEQQCGTAERDDAVRQRKFQNRPVSSMQATHEKGLDLAHSFGQQDCAQGG